MEHVMYTKVRSTDIDFVGHVNHVNYLVYMEWGRVELISMLGFPMTVMKARNVLPVAVSLQVNYRKELTFDEQVKIVSRLAEIGNKSYAVRHELYNESDDLVCDADVKMVMIDADRRRAIEVPEEIRRAYSS